LLGAGSREPADLFARVPVRIVELEELVGPASLENLNTPEDYRAALAQPLPSVTVEGRPAAGAILADVWQRPGRVLLNGVVTDASPTLPLVDGDVIATA
jgi:hypothetical protein